VHGVAVIGERDGRPVIAVRPTTSWSWGILGPTFAAGNPIVHRTDWTAGS
jgi:hypothetical protein